MHLDYINKRFQCPICHAYEMVYIDLNEIRNDPRASSGICRRVLYHNDHGMILDIDLNGDIRAINPIKKKLDMHWQRQKLVLSDNFLNKLLNTNLLLLSSDQIIYQVILNEMKTLLGNKIPFKLELSDGCSCFSYKNSRFMWYTDDTGFVNDNFGMVIVDLLNNILSDISIISNHKIIFLADDTNHELIADADRLGIEYELVNTTYSEKIHVINEKI